MFWDVTATSACGADSVNPTPDLILVMLFLIYLALLLSAGLMTLRKGHTVLAIVGLVIPPLWLVGAMMPPRKEAQPAKPSARKASAHHRRHHK
jgi:hypothetical protein